MICTITITRSPQWVSAQRLARAENVPEKITVPVLVAELSQAGRTLLLRWGGGYYPAIQNKLAFNREFEPVRDSYYGSLEFFVDSDAPTAAEIDAAILAAGRVLDQKREAWQAEVAERQVREQALAQEWAALPLNQRASVDGICYCRRQGGPLCTSGTVQYPREVLTQYVPEAVEEAVAESKRLAAVVAGQQAIADRAILAEFLAAIPQDALRGALRSATAGAGEDAAEAMRQMVEDASPITIFDLDDE